jgi:hypothetical protein
MLKRTDVSEMRTTIIRAMNECPHDAVRISETSVHFNVTTRSYIAEDSKLQFELLQSLSL